MKRLLSRPCRAPRLAALLFSLYPQAGLWANPGTVSLQANVFTHLQQGYSGAAQQGAGTGTATGNSFVGCRIGLGFYNRRNAGPAGRATLTCNSFAQVAGSSGDCYGVYLEAGPYVAGQLGQQVNISNTGSAPILQTNRFDGPLPGAGATTRFWHVYNDGWNARMDYTHYDAGARGSRVPGDATVVGDNTNGASGVQLMAVTFGPGSTLNLGNNCASRGYPNTGLQRVAPTPPPTTYQLAQNVPNPCSGSTSVSYRVPVGAKVVQLVIRDSYSGRVWKRENLEAGERTVDVLVAALPPGAYHYSLEVDGRPVAHYQLLVQ